MGQPDGEVTTTLRPVVDDQYRSTITNLVKRGSAQEAIRKIDSDIDRLQSEYRALLDTGQIYDVKDSDSDDPKVFRLGQETANTGNLDPDDLEDEAFANFNTSGSTKPIYDPALSSNLRQINSLYALRDQVETTVGVEFERSGGLAGLEYMISQGGGTGGGAGQSVSKQLKSQWDAFIDRVTDVNKLVSSSNEQAQAVRDANLGLAGPVISSITGGSFSGPTGFASAANRLLSEQQAQNFGIGQFTGGGSRIPIDNPLPPGVGPEAFAFTSNIPSQSVLRSGGQSYINPGEVGISPLQAALLGGTTANSINPSPFYINPASIKSFQGGTEQIEGVDPSVQEMVGRPSIHIPAFIAWLQQTGRWIE